MWLLWLMRSDTMRWGQLYVIHMDRAKRRRACFLLMEEEMSRQAQLILIAHTYFESPNAPQYPAQTLLFMTLLLNGKMNPGGPLSPPLSSLCSASILIKSWAHIPSYFANPLLVSSQLTIDKEIIFFNLPGGAPLLSLRGNNTQRVKRKKHIIFPPTYYSNLCWLHFLFSKSLIPPSIWSY